MSSQVVIIGGGLAGSEAAWQVAKRGGSAIIYEMKPRRFSPAHRMETLAELVCSNSLKSDDPMNASGLLKEEMRLMGSLVIKAAEATRVAAGKTLAVDRSEFSRYVTEVLAGEGVELVREEVRSIPEARPVIVATGPLTTEELAGDIQALVGKKSLFFYDAVAPVVYAESIDMSRAFFASRYGKGGEDYINCPLDREQYERFVRELKSADGITPRSFEETRYFEGCLPIEVLAGRGPMTLSFGPMKPVGLVDPGTGRRPYAVVQLRKENSQGTLYNMVGFQTRLTYTEQKRVFGLIPALEKAEFARLGKIHRNTYMDSPGVISPGLALLRDQGIFFAGQITGVEGYCESAATGLLAGINAFLSLEGRLSVHPPPTTMTGSLLEYITSEKGSALQPMNANFGLLPPLPISVRDKSEKKRLQRERALGDLQAWLKETLATSPVI